MQQVHQSGSAARSRLDNWMKRIADPHHSWLTRPLLAFLVTRLIVLFSAYLAEIAIPSITGDGIYHVAPGNIFLDVWARWDSAFYLRIVEQGYWLVPGQQSAAAFFPLYPLLMSLIEPVAGSTLAAGILVSNACLLGALIFLYRLAELEFSDSATASRTVFYIAAFPTAFFFTAVYTESTFLFFTVATMYFARKRLWVWAGLFGLLASATRVVGVVMWGAVGLEWLRYHGWTFSTVLKREAWAGLALGLRQDWLNLAAICLMPLGLLSYMLFLNHQFGDPVAFSTTQSAWGRETIGFWMVVRNDLAALVGGNFLTGDIWYHVVLDFGALFAVVIVAVQLWRRLGAGYALYCLLSILIPASSGSTSLSRYALVIFPVFMMLGHWGRLQWLDRTLMIGFSAFLGVMTSIFVNWVFIA